MEKVIRISLLSLLISVMFSSVAFAAEKAFDSYGLYDLTKTMNQPDADKINSLLKAIYDQDGLSIYLLNAGSLGSKTDLLDGFLNKYVFPNPEIFDRGVAILCDDTGDFAFTTFSGDGSINEIFTDQYLDTTIQAVIYAAYMRSFELYESLALELRARAKEYNGGVKDAMASSNNPIPDKLDAPDYVKIKILSNSAGRRYLSTEFGMLPATAKLNDHVLVVVSFNLDWKINDGQWFSEMDGTQKYSLFLPYRTNARSVALLSDFFEDGDWGNIDVENNVYSFRGYFDFVAPDRKQIRSPFTDVITLTAKQ